MLDSPYSCDRLQVVQGGVLARQSVKQKVLEAVEGLPSDATVEDAMERLYFLAKIQRGLDQADAGNTLSHEEAKGRLLK